MSFSKEVLDNFTAVIAWREYIAFFAMGYGSGAGEREKRETETEKVGTPKVESLSVVDPMHDANHFPLSTLLHYAVAA